MLSVANEQKVSALKRFNSSGFVGMRQSSSDLGQSEASSQVTWSVWTNQRPVCRSHSDFIRHLNTEQTFQQQCCCNLGFSVVIGVSYKTAAALDVVLLLHHLTNLLLLLLLARCVQTREWTTAPANSTITFLSLRTITWSHCVWWSLDHCSGHSIIVSLSWWLVMMTRDHSYHAIVMTVRAPGVTSSLSQLRVTTEPGSGLEPRICHRLYTCTFTCTPVYSHLFTCVQCNSVIL